MKVRHAGKSGPIMILRENRARERGTHHTALQAGEVADVKADNPSFQIWLLAGIVLPADKESEKLLADLKAEAKV
jgi:hypothetical protein